MLQPNNKKRFMALGRRQKNRGPKSNMGLIEFHKSSVSSPDKIPRGPFPKYMLGGFFSMRTMRTRNGKELNWIYRAY